MLTKLLALKNSYVKNESGATAIEYGLIAAGIAVAISLAVFLLGDRLTLLFQQIADMLQ